MLIVFFVAAIAITLYYCLVLPRLRRLAWWDGAAAEVRAVLERACGRLRAFCGNSKTIAVAYAAELLGVLDEAKVLDWSQLLGAESAGRVMVITRAWRRSRKPVTAFEEQVNNVFSLFWSMPRGVPARRRARWPAAPIPRPWPVR